MPQFFERWFKVSSPVEGVNYVLIGRDSIGWKMDVLGHSSNEWPDGDTYQDTLDELLPFVAKYVDHASVWSDFETGAPLPMFDAITSITGRLE